MNRIFKNRKALKWVIIAEAIVCYMVFLAVISYLRGPVRYQVLNTTSLLEIHDFTTFAGEPVTAERFTLANAEPGVPVGCQAQISLRELRRLHIQFSLYCPAEYSGGTLFVDLYEPGSAYDNPEQEASFTLTEGENLVDFSIDTGESAPENAYLRFFTLDPAGYTVQNFKICRESAMPRVSGGLIVFMLGCFAVFIVTIVLYFCNNSKKQRIS